MSGKELTKPRGRPRLDPAERKAGNLTFRTRGDLREQLAQRAEASGRSISEEVEARLVESLSQEATGAAVARATKEAIGQFAEAYASQGIHSALEELCKELGHPFALAVAIQAGKAFSAAAAQGAGRAKKGEVWIDNPEIRASVSADTTARIGAILQDWSALMYGESQWSLFERYRRTILRQAAAGAYGRPPADGP